MAETPPSGEAVDSGEGGNVTPPSGLNAFILEVFGGKLRDTEMAYTFPSSDVRPSYYTLLHSAREPELYLFTKMFEADDTPPQNFELRVDDGKVFLGIKTALSREEFAKYGEKVAAQYMAWQDWQDFSQPDEQGKADFGNMFSDFVEATRNGELAPLDLSVAVAEQS